MSSGGRGPRLASDPHKRLNPHKPQASYQQLLFLMFYPIYLFGLLQVENMKTFEKACKSTIFFKRKNVRIIMFLIIVVYVAGTLKCLALGQQSGLEGRSGGLGDR